MVLISSIFIYSHQFTDPYILTKWLITILVILGIGIYCFIRILMGKALRVNMSFIGISIVLVCCIEAIYGLSQYFNILSTTVGYKVTGSFDNPAGFAACLCTSIPFSIFLIQNNRMYIKCIGWFLVAIFVLSIVLSQSRAGIISVSILCFIYLYNKWNKQKLRKLFLLLGMVALIICCYWMKKDSADGRLLIWQCGINMAKKSPLIGHGIGSFEAHYMDYQADYFRNNQESRYSMLANNVKQPFNEYLGVLLNFGVLGLLLLFSLIGLLIYCYKKNPNTEKRVALYSLISIGVFSLFSYPFTYPFTWIILFLCIFIIAKEHIKCLLNLYWARYIICFLALGGSVIGIYKIAERIRNEREWGKVAAFALCNDNESTLLHYEKLKEYFADNPYFLYNYAAVLLENKEYKESLQVALQCRRYWADYDLEIIIGENYQNLNEIRLAEKYYYNASFMCPSRFLPFYKLLSLYKENGKNERMLTVADNIINKPMKFKTPTIVMMKREAKRVISKLQASY